MYIPYENVMRFGDVICAWKLLSINNVQAEMKNPSSL